MPQTDYDLLNGNSNDFNVLYQRYNFVLHRFVEKFQFGKLPIDNYELVQIIWIRIYQKKELYQNWDSFRNWMYKLAIRVILNYGRDEKIQRFNAKNYSLEFLEDIIDSSLKEPIEDLFVSEVRAIVRRAIDDLSEDEQIAIQQVYIEGSETTNGPYRSAIRRARYKLRNSLRGCTNDTRASSYPQKIMECKGGE